ncbi:MAG: hypothetical protein H7328_03510 [Bdellovibrio sp.]|nr:hypothetical protein [Bdellovibrio sp.]
MVALWITIGLVVSTLCVSILGATFSVVGIGALFSGALLAVWAMAGSLELAKFVLAAYVHQRWANLNLAFKSYMVFAIVVLSLITSMGIFGFLSDAYQSASLAMDSGNIKIEAKKTQLANYKNEIARINKSIDEIPDARISRKMKARTEADPMIQSLNLKVEGIEKEISEANLDMLEIKKKVGPLIYVARAFNMDIDSVVKYFILIFVSVFDPLAICLVIAMSQAIESRKRKNLVATENQATAASAVTPLVDQPVIPEVPVAPAVVAQANVVTANTHLHGGDDQEMLLMRFTDDPKEEISESKDKNGNAV